MRRSITRRRAIGAGAALVAGAAAAQAAPASLPAQPSLLVAGPAGSQVDHWADVIAPPLGRELLGSGKLSLQNVGGADGVTGINQFQARTNPDGATALLLPGTALLAWLVGDTRAQFDAGTWAPLWGGITGAIVASRAPLVPGRSVRLAVRSVAGPELEALLALELMGIEAVPAPARPDNALARADVDAVYLRGAALRDSQALLSQGWRPAFALSRARNGGFANVPLASELFGGLPPSDTNLLPAYRAVAAASALEVALVLPLVAPATVLAWWRRGCNSLDDTASVRDAAAAAIVHQADAGQVAAQLASVTLETSAMLSLRRWLADRYNFRPS
ncbi:MAG: hypothetical protein RQ966_10645 [Acetobacteraceae bacterium]|nr:hypothetical protein [Acetobacteraceae bacterium]